MGKRALEVKKSTVRRIRIPGLSVQERSFLHEHAAYEGSPHHKKNPGDFGLTPPAAPRPDKTLCDEAGIQRRDEAVALLARAIDGGLVSAGTVPENFPKQLWVVDDEGRVFEAMSGGSRAGRYHGYPIRRTDPLFDQVSKAWEDR
jgi:hypothetical protein